MLKTFQIWNLQLMKYQKIIYKKCLRNYKLDLRCLDRQCQSYLLMEPISIDMKVKWQKNLSLNKNKLIKTETNKLIKNLNLFL